MRGRPLMVGLGELLWDLLPAGRVMGGAPANFAYMSTVLGNEGVVASRLGCDALGQEARQVMEALHLCTSYVQSDEEHATGTAGVVLDAGGQPKFTIKYPVAWDYLEWTPAWEELSARTDVVCFGSLAQRSAVSAATIERFLHHLPKTALRICDVNLREPFYSTEVLGRCFRHANILKVNIDELLRISTLMKMNLREEEAIARRLMQEFELVIVCITRGAKGSLLVSLEDVADHPGLDVKVADAVGAGDAFTACLAHYYIRGEKLEKISERANRFASWVATQVGATPIIPSNQLQEILCDDTHPRA